MAGLVERAVGRSAAYNLRHLNPSIICDLSICQHSKQDGLGAAASQEACCREVRRERRGGRDGSGGVSNRSMHHGGDHLDDLCLKLAGGLEDSGVKIVGVIKDGPHLRVQGEVVKISGEKQKSKGKMSRKLEMRLGEKGRTNTWDWSASKGVSSVIS